MKLPVFCKNRRRIAQTAAIAVLVVFMVSLSIGTAWAAKGWVKTDTFRVMNFVVLIGLLIFLLRKPVAQALSQRIKEIQSQLDDLEARKTEAEKQLSDYTAKFSDLNQEAEKLIADYVKQGEEAKARILKEAESAADKLEDQARRNIEHEFAQAKMKLQEEVLEKALAKAEEMIKTKITGDDQEKLVDEYLTKLDKVVA